jgi:hypothetical protein
MFSVGKKNEMAKKEELKGNNELEGVEQVDCITTSRIQASVLTS